MFLFIWLQLPSTFSIWWRFWPHLQFFLVERSSLLDDASNTQWRSLTSNFKLYIGVEQKCVKAAKSDDSQRHFYLAPVKANTGRKASSKDIIHFDSSPPQRDKKPNMAVCLNLQKRNRCQSWCQHKNRKRSQAPNAPPTAGNAANHRESRAALCLILRCWHLEGNFTLRRCHMVTAVASRAQLFPSSRKGTDSTICRVSTAPHDTEWSSCVKLLACFTPHSVGGSRRRKIAV